MENMKTEAELKFASQRIVGNGCVHESDSEFIEFSSIECHKYCMY